VTGVTQKQQMRALVRAGDTLQPAQGGAGSGIGSPPPGLRRAADFDAQGKDT